MRKPRDLVMVVRMLTLKTMGLPSGQFEPFNSYSESIHTQKSDPVLRL